MSAFLSFLGGSAFRAIWAGVAGFIEKRQEHSQELQRMRLQSELESAQHDRQLAGIRIQSELGIKTIEIQSTAAQNIADAEGFAAAIKLAAMPTGIKFIDGWNGSIRPAYATVGLAIWIASLYVRGWVLTPWDLELSASIAGFYFADRSLRRNKH